MSETLEQIVKNLHQKMPMATQEDAIEFARRLVAALGEVVVTTDEDGRAVAVTRQDEEGRILSVIWEAAPEYGK